MLLFLLFYSVLDLGNPANSSAITVAMAKAERGKLFWGASAFSLSFTLIWSSLTAIAIIRSSVSNLPHQRRIRVWATVIVIVCLGGALLYPFNIAGSSGNDLLVLIEKEAKVSIIKLTRIGNVFTFMTVTLVVASVCGLARPVAKLDANSIAQRIKFFVFSLYSSAALLVTGLIEIYALYKWGAAVSGTQEVSRGMTADALAISAGIVLTILLIAIYAPVAIIQHQWLDLLLEEESTRIKDLDVSKWLPAHGLKPSPIGISGAMLAPLITGLLTNLIKLLA